MRRALQRVLDRCGAYISYLNTLAEDHSIARGSCTNKRLFKKMVRVLDPGGMCPLF